jgi:hypothetical protein
VAINNSKTSGLNNDSLDCLDKEYSSSCKIARRKFASCKIRPKLPKSVDEAAKI